jgi:pimeloyl-ACP methyl ester carboxylesterase
MLGRRLRLFMDTPASPPSKPWFRWIIFGLLLFALGLCAVGFLYENIAEARDMRFNPMPGRLVDVDGRKTHINCIGDGSPVVILDSGLGDTYISWHKVQPEIAKFTRVCSYDRAGLGYSDPSSEPRTSKVIAQELHVLLSAANIPPPYVLVGHSMAGFDVRLFASAYRSEVAGMVLVDASHPEQESRLPLELKNLEGTELREIEFLEFTMPFGAPRLLNLCDDDALARAAECNFHSVREAVAELKAIHESADEAATTGPFGDMPLIVLSHDPDKPSAELSPDLARSTNEAWTKMQEELSHLSTRGTRQIARNSAHYIQLDRPEVVVDAVRTVVSQCRAIPASSMSVNH